MIYFLNNLICKIPSLAGLQGKFINGKKRGLPILRILVFAVAIIMVVQPFGYQVQAQGPPDGCSCSDSDNCHEFKIGDENFPTRWPNLVNKISTSDTFWDPDGSLGVTITGVYWKDCPNSCPCPTEGCDHSVDCSECELTVFDWDSFTSGVSVDEVYLFGGGDEETYTYDPEVTSDYDNLTLYGHNSDGECSGAGCKAISHITFCYDTELTPSLSLSFGNLEIAQSNYSSSGKFALSQITGVSPGEDPTNCGPCSVCAKFDDELTVTINNCSDFSGVEAWYNMLSSTATLNNHPVLLIDKDDDGTYEELKYDTDTEWDASTNTTSLTMSSSPKSFPIKVCLDRLGDMSTNSGPFRFDIWVKFTCGD
mgnify:CR=1 FL=1